MDTPAAILHAVADRFLVNTEPDGIHPLHGGASLVVSESAGSLSSAFLHQALLNRLIHSNNPPRIGEISCGPKLPRSPFVDGFMISEVLIGACEHDRMAC